eukprot:COSAG02_NODE_1512_length_12212_cov_4.145133_6_plen_92_part_00
MTSFRDGGYLPANHLGGRVGDWECYFCGKISFDFRTECFGCGASKREALRTRSGSRTGSSRDRMLEFDMMMADAPDDYDYDYDYDYYGDHY